MYLDILRWSALFGLVMAVLGILCNLAGVAVDLAPWMIMTGAEIFLSVGALYYIIRELSEDSEQ